MYSTAIYGHKFITEGVIAIAITIADRYIAIVEIINMHGVIGGAWKNFTIICTKLPNYWYMHGYLAADHMIWGIETDISIESDILCIPISYDLCYCEIVPVINMQDR